MFLLISTVCVYFVTNVESAWRSPGSILADACDYCAAAAYGDRIFLIGGALGGIEGYEAVTEYRVDAADTLTLITQHIINIDLNQLMGYSQFWTQINEMVYMIYPTNSIAVDSVNKIATYNMTTRQFTHNWHNITLQKKVDFYACVASFNGSLYIAGGNERWGKHHKTLQILNLLSLSWTPNVPDMNIERSLTSCIVYNDMLWIFGGDDANYERLQSNERIDIIDITQKAWKYTAPLTEPISGSRAVVFQDMIYVIGGTNGGTSASQTNKVHIMNPYTEMMTLSTEFLAYTITYCSPLVLNDIIYVFGGKMYSSNTDQWMYYIVPVTTTTLTHSTTQLTQDLNVTNMNDGEALTSTIIVSHAHTEMERSTEIPVVKNTINLLINYDVLVLLVAVIIVFIMCFICCCVLFFMHNKLQKKSAEPKADEMVMIQMSNKQDKTLQQQLDFDTDLVVSWIKYTLKLPQYKQLFIAQGYDSMRAIQEIESITDLEELGIKRTGHKRLILSEIRKLEGTYGMKTNASASQFVVEDKAAGHMTDGKIAQQNAFGVQWWLVNVVQLPQYYNTFIDNGYDSLCIMKEIASVVELKEIGIDSIVHQSKLFREITELKHEPNFRELFLSIEGNNEMLMTEEGN